MFWQNKINAYASFIESGEFETAYPDAKGRQPVIHVACMNEPPPVAVRFFDRVRDILQPAGIRFHFAIRLSIPRLKQFREQAKESECRRCLRRCGCRGRRLSGSFAGILGARRMVRS